MHGFGKCTPTNASLLLLQKVKVRNGETEPCVSKRVSHLQLIWCNKLQVNDIVVESVCRPIEIPHLWVETVVYFEASLVT